MRTETLRGFIMATHQVRAVAEGRLTQASMVHKPQPKDGETIEHLTQLAYQGTDMHGKYAILRMQNGKSKLRVQNPKYKVGEYLYVKEEFCATQDGILYRSDTPDGKAVVNGQPVLWTNAGYMYKGAARYFLKVTGSRLVRVQDLTVDDLCAEGMPTCSEKGRCTDDCTTCTTKRGVRFAFAEKWDRNLSEGIKRVYGYDANPYVWVYTFERVERAELVEKGLIYNGKN